MGRFRKSSYTQREIHEGKHRFEHWYRDNTVYFITSKVVNGAHAFASEQAKQIFWDRFNHYSAKYDFVPWVRTLMINHYHFLGYLKNGANLGPFMQHLHGSVAKLVNDTLHTRIVPFWRTKGNKDYFDGCIRDELQLRRAFRYTLLQSVRAGLVRNYRDYPHTTVDVELEIAVKRAKNLNVYLEEVPYARYERKRSRGR
jgi:hypothetical protein